MINAIKAGALLNDPSDRRSQQGQDERDGETPRRPPQPAPDVRLLIEPDETGVLIYKLVDRATGAVISTVSRDDILRMVSDPSYTAGAVFSTTA